MAAALRERFTDVEIEMIRSGGGVFEVELDGHLIYSKKATGRHPTNEEVVGLIRS